MYEGMGVADGAVDTGNNAWVGMAFAHYAAATGDACRFRDSNPNPKTLTPTGTRTVTLPLSPSRSRRLSRARCYFIRGARYACC